MRPPWLYFTAVLALGACHRHNTASAGSAAAHSAGDHPGAELPAMSVDDLAGRIERHERIGVFDANNRTRYETGHIPGAVWVAFNDLHASDLPQDHGTALVFYCANEH
jgi:hypothetical protein